MFAMTETKKKHEEMGKQASSVQKHTFVTFKMFLNLMAQMSMNGPNASWPTTEDVRDSSRRLH